MLKFVVKNKVWEIRINPIYFLFFCLFRTTPMACGGSQARGLIGATATGLCHSHSNVGSELSLQPTPELMAPPDP